jgi:hypothetical protein
MSKVPENNDISLQNKKGKGRPAGSPNVSTAALKDMILGALSDVGGQKYLAQQAIDNPSAFMSLIGRVLPKDVAVTGVMSIQVITGVDAD